MKSKYVMIVGKVFDAEYFGIRKYYLEFLSRFGEVLVIPPLSTDGFDSLLDLCKLLVLPGGSDISPAASLSIPSIWTGEPDPFMEYYDAVLLPLVTKREIPVLGICRGFQALLKHYRVPIVQNLPDHPYSEEWDQLVHSVKRMDVKGVIRDSMVNSLHHQGQYVTDVPDELEVIATANKDGICEAFVHPKDRVLGIQWHPEVLPIDPWVIDWVTQLVSG